MQLYTSDESRQIGYSFVPDRSWLFNLHIEKFSIQQLKARKSPGTKLYAGRGERKEENVTLNNK